MNLRSMKLTDIGQFAAAIALAAIAAFWLGANNFVAGWVCAIMFFVCLLALLAGLALNSHEDYVKRLASCKKGFVGRKSQSCPSSPAFLSRIKAHENQKTFFGYAAIILCTIYIVGFCWLAFSSYDQISVAIQDQLVEANLDLKDENIDQKRYGEIVRKATQEQIGAQLALGLSIFIITCSLAFITSYSRGMIAYTGRSLVLELKCRLGDDQDIEEITTRLFRGSQIYEPAGNIFVLVGIATTFTSLAAALLGLSVSGLSDTRPETLLQFGTCAGLALLVSMLGVILAIISQRLRGTGAQMDIDDLINRRIEPLPDLPAQDQAGDKAQTSGHATATDPAVS